MGGKREMKWFRKEEEGGEAKDGGSSEPGWH